MSGDPPEPTRAQIFALIKANFAVTVGIGTLLLSTGTVLWAGGGWVRGQQARFDQIQVIEEALRRSADHNHEDLVDVDKRLEELSISRTDARRQVDRSIADLASRVLIMETQLKFVGDRVQQQPGKR